MTPVLESLLHLLPTSASVHAADGEPVTGEQAAAICRLLANPPADQALPDLCARDCRALAREAISSGGRVRGQCSAGLACVAEPLHGPDGGPAGLGVLVAAVGDAPRDPEHWQGVAARYGRRLEDVVEAVSKTARVGLRDWEGEERIEVAAALLTRVLSGAQASPPATTVGADPRAPSARRQTAQLVLEVAHASAEAVDEVEMLRYLPLRVKALLGLPAAWALLLRPASQGGSLLVDAPDGLRSDAYPPSHPAVARAHAGRTTHHADLHAWPDAADLERAGVARLLVAPVRVLGDLAALLFFALDPREEAPATISRRCALLDDLTPIVAANLTGARALGDERRRNRQLTALNEVTRRMSSSLDTSTVLDAVMTGYLDALGYTRSAIFLHDEATKTVAGVASRGRDTADRVRAISGPLSDFPAAEEAARAGGAIFVHADEEKVPRAYRQGLGVGSFIIVPLVADGRLLGFIATDKGGDDFKPTEHDLAFATMLAQPAAISLAQAHLHESLEASYRELRSAQEQLLHAERLRYLREMSTGVAHDMNEVLNAILSRATRSLGAPEPLSPRLREDLTAILRACAEGASTVRRLQDVALQRPRPSRRRVALRDVAEDVADLLAGRLAARSTGDGTIDVVRLLDDAGTIEGDAGDLREVLTNVATATADSLAHGGRIVIATGRREAAGGERAFACVTQVASDAGQADSRVSRVPTPWVGAVAASRDIVERHGGRMAVENGDGGAGTTVTITFPIAPASEAEQDAQDARPSHDSEAPAAPGLRVLVVDDDEDSRAAVSGLLRSWGHDVRSADSGEAAVDALLEADVDLVLTDLAMPGLTGWDVAQRVRATRPRTSVALVTGWTLDLAEDEIRRRGVDTVIEKPASPAKLRSLLARCSARSPA